jgi:carboxymethylenebutenolidase
MQTKWIDVQTADGAMRSYLATPDGDGPYPGVVVLQEAFGVNEYVRSVADRLADAGFVALAPELFHRKGHHVELAYDAGPKILEHMVELTNDTMEEDIASSIAALRARHDVDPKRLATIGFCMGGFAAILGGLTTAVAAVVAFYPGGLVKPRSPIKFEPLVDRMPKLKAATLLQYGADDKGISREDIELVKQAMAQSGARYEVDVYPNAGHGFHSHDRAGAYAPEAAEAAWHRTLTWLRDMLA